MNPTRLFTFVGLMLVILAMIPVAMGRYLESIYLLGFVAVAGAGLAVWNWLK